MHTFPSFGLESFMLQMTYLKWPFNQQQIIDQA